MCSVGYIFAEVALMLKTFSQVHCCKKYHTILFAKNYETCLETHRQLELGCLKGDRKAKNEFGP